ncbi:AMP-binding enzyme [Streptomyces sp. NPDC054933]
MEILGDDGRALPPGAVGQIAVESHPSVGEAAVGGVPLPGGDLLVAAVVPRGTPDAAALIAHCRDPATARTWPATAWRKRTSCTTPGQRGESAAATPPYGAMGTCRQLAR